MTKHQLTHMTKDAAPCWYIVRSRPSSENRAGEEIIALGQTVYVPQFRKEYKHHRHKKWITRYFPLLRGYLFILASPHWARCLSCDSVERVLRDQRYDGAGDPIPIPNAEVQRIRSAQEAGAFDQLRVHGSDIDVGAKVQIAEGAMAGLLGTVQKAGDEKLTMTVMMFNREVSTKAPIAMLSRKE